MKDEHNIRPAQRPLYFDVNIAKQIAERMNSRISQLLNQEEETNIQSFKKYDKPN